MILSVPFCPYYVVPFHFVLEPIKSHGSGDKGMSSKHYWCD